MSNPDHEWITSLFPGGGYFVEVGAHDGVGDSHTKSLEDLGWTGVCVEPSSAFAGLKASRRCRVDDRCLWKKDGVTVPFWETPGNRIELSGIKSCFRDHWDRSEGKEVLKDSVTLTTLLREHDAPATIEFLSLDTEGSEYEILSAHDFDAFRFLAMIVEHNGVEAQRNLVRKLLRERDYRVCNESEIEDWYVHGGIQEKNH